jgi:hypothetical protein
MITYSWSIPQLEVVLKDGAFTDVVQTIHWRLVGKNADGVEAEVYGTQAVPAPTPGGSFLAYSSVTQADAERWLVGAMPEDDLKRHKKAVEDAIAIKVAPVKRTSAPPWPKA